MRDGFLHYRIGRYRPGREVAVRRWRGSANFRRTTLARMRDLTARGVHQPHQARGHGQARHDERTCNRILSGQVESNTEVAGKCRNLSSLRI